MIGIYDILRERSSFFPDKLAVVSEYESYTYQQLCEYVNCVSYGLHEVGIRRGSRVGMMLYNGIDFVATFYALIKLGACISPFNYRYNVEETSVLQSIVDCEYMIVSKDFADVYSMLAQKSKSIKIVPLDSEPGKPSIEQFRSNGHSTWDFVQKMCPEDIIFNIFTGGTTGLPKASQHSHQNVLDRVVGFLMNTEVMAEDDVFLNYSPMFHTGGLTAMIRILAVGGTLCLLSKFDSDNIIRMISEYKVTQISLIPPNILHRFAEKKAQGLDLSSIRLIRLAGDAADETTVELAFELMPHAKCVNTYGHSEAVLYFLNAFDKDEFYADRTLVRSVGKPQMFCQVKIMDENRKEVPDGVAGEAYGKSPSMMSGYKGRADSFTEDGWFATGDIMSRDINGNYHFHSRSKDMIKSGGENIYAAEVENAIMKNHDIAECAVVPLPCKEWGECVSAAVVLKPGVSTTEIDIIEHCSKYISSYKKPKKVFFLDELPRSNVGKVQKHILKEELNKLL